MHVLYGALVGSLIGTIIGNLIGRPLVAAWYRWRDRDLPEALRRV